MSALAHSPERRLPTPCRLLRLRSDTALAERFAAGDESAFAVLYERHRASVLAVCIGVLGSRHDAEDAAQESFASLAVALRATPPRDLRPWLTRVARNAAIDLARRRRLDPSAEAELHDRHAVATARDTELEIVIAGLRELPESQRTALLMRELAGHSYQEIAGLLETDEEAVRGLIARARIGLRNYREAAELPCATVRAALASEADGRRRPKEVRRHLRTCPSCRAYRRSLRADARALRAIMPVQSGAFAGGTAVAGGLATKGVLVGTAMTQLTAACMVSVSAVGGIVLLGAAGHSHRAAPVAPHAVQPSTAPASVGAGAGASMASNTDGWGAEAAPSAGSAWQLVGGAAAANPVGGPERSSTTSHRGFGRSGAGRRGGLGGPQHGPGRQAGVGRAGTGSGQVVSARSGAGGAPSGAGSTGARHGAPGGHGDSANGSSSRTGGSRSGGKGSSSADGGPSSTANGSSSANGSSPAAHESSGAASGGSGGVRSAADGQNGSAGAQRGSGGSAGGSGGSAGATGGSAGATGASAGGTGGSAGGTGGSAGATGGSAGATGGSAGGQSGSPGGQGGSAGQ